MTKAKNEYLSDYEREMVTALYRTIGYLAEQDTSTPEIRKVLCNEITQIENKAKKREADDMYTWEQTVAAKKLLSDYTGGTF